MCSKLGNIFENTKENMNDPLTNIEWQWLCIIIGELLGIDFTRLYLKAEEDSNFIFKPICCIAAKLGNEHLNKELSVNILSYNFTSELVDVDVKITTIHQKILDSNHIISFSQYMKRRIQKLERMLDNLDNNSTQMISVSRYMKEKQDYIKQIENLEKEANEYIGQIDAFEKEKNTYIEIIKDFNEEIKNLKSRYVIYIYLFIIYKIYTQIKNSAGLLR